MIRIMAIGVAAMTISACTTAELEAVSAGLAQGMAQASAQAQYGSGYGYGQPGYGSPYGQYTPGGFSSGYWPVPSYGYGAFVGRYQCRNTGSMYSCDSDGDGYIDMWGDTDDGSYYSRYSRVNGRGEGFSWDRDCNCWRRDRTLDGPYKGPRDGRYRRR